MIGYVLWGLWGAGCGLLFAAIIVSISEEVENLMKRGIR